MEQVEVQSLSHLQSLDSHHRSVCFRISTFKLQRELRQQSLYSCQDIMSDYEYQEEYQYEQEANEEDVETRVELEYFQIEGLIREGKWQQSIDELQRLYTTAQQNNLKNYKVKILNQLLQIYSKNSRKANLKSTLERISSLNNQEKYTETAIKSIIAILRASDYANIREDLLNFIAGLDPLLKIKSYLMLLEKSVEEKDIKDSQNIFGLIEKIDLETLPANILLEIYSLQIKLSKLTKTDISDKIREIELRIPTLESQAYMSQGHISILKLTIAENMYKNQNYENAALYIGQAFFEKAKYGNSTQLKEILKANVLISLLIEDPQLRKDGRYNLLLHDSSHPFKNDKEIHQLIALADAYDKHDLAQFSRNYQSVKFRPQNEEYLLVQKKLLWNMKKQKLLIILKAYQTISFQHIGRRLQMNNEQVQLMAFKLIVDEKIRGRICHSQKNGKYLFILPERNEFLQIQAENLKQLSKRYLLA